MVGEATVMEVTIIDLEVEVAVQNIICLAIPIILHFSNIGKMLSIHY